MKSLPALILASTSPYRRQLLARLGIPFETIAPGVDETRQPDELGRSLVERLAREKAGAVALRRPHAWVIGSDQTAILHGANGAERLLGKPGSAANCIDQLHACSGRTLSFLTGVTVMRQGGPLFEFIDVTRVAFRNLDRAAIERYVANETPFDCAGGFKSEGLGISLCETIDTCDPTGLIGLPLIRLCTLLRNAGFALP